MESIWKKTAELPEFHTLTKDIRTKVLIIGGGMAGILCAYFFAAVRGGLLSVRGRYHLQRRDRKYDSKDHITARADL